MPRTYVINNKYIGLEINSNMISNKSNPSYEVVSRSKDPEVSKNDLFVMMEPLSLNDKDDKYEFKYEGIISSVGQTIQLPTSIKDQIENENRKARNEPPLSPEYSRKIELEIIKALPGHNYFDDYAYSLLTVRNYNKPIIHFQQKHRIIDHNDFESITNGWVYIARTAFGKIVNALPRPNRLEFTLYVMNRFKTNDLRGLPYTELLEFLFDYIEKHLHSQGKLLVASDNIIQNELSNTGIPHQEVGFIDEELNKSNLLYIQAGYFRTLFETDQKYNLLNTLNSGIRNSPQETRFDKLFKKRLWPLHLN
ncbi:MAG TPA: hypothetical protein VNW06_02345 [Cytophagaceae bacterium]|jgi:hypothetical protein|nr:hypothetical protein [Cytophagaceae bacterium]